MSSSEFIDFDTSSYNTNNICAYDDEHNIKMNFEEYVKLCMTSYCTKCLKCPLKVLTEHSENDSTINKTEKEIEMQKEKIVNVTINKHNNDVLCYDCHNICIVDEHIEHLKKNIIIDVRADMHKKSNWKFAVIHDKFQKLNGMVFIGCDKNIKNNVDNKSQNTLPIDNIYECIIKSCIRFPYLVQWIQQNILLITMHMNSKNIDIRKGSLQNDVIKLKLLNDNFTNGELLLNYKHDTLIQNVIDDICNSHKNANKYHVIELSAKIILNLNLHNYVSTLGFTPLNI